MEKIDGYAEQHPEKQTIPAFFSADGFTDEAREFCNKKRHGLCSGNQHILTSRHLSHSCESRND
jgi:hypothetical protein